MSVQISPPFKVYQDRNGEPLNDGHIYVGAANQDPVTNPVAVFSDAALTVTVAQPIRTSGGAAVVNGAPVNLYVGGNYSITVKDRNNTLVYSLASAALAGGDITLASGETLTAQSGSTIDMKDGSTLNLGDGDGGGVQVVVAPTTRITGDLVPSATGKILGSLTNLWDAFIQALVVTSTILPSAIGAATIGAATFAFSRLFALRVTANDGEFFSTDQPGSTDDLVRKTQSDCLLAGARQTSTGNPAVTVNVLNVGTIVRNSAGNYTIPFAFNIGATGERFAHATLRDGAGQISCSCGDSQALVLTFDPTGLIPTDAAFDFSVRGNPGVANPIAQPPP